MSIYSVGYELLEALRAGKPYDTDELTDFVETVLEYTFGKPADTGPDRVTLVSVWASVMYAHHKAILIGMAPIDAGIMLRAELPEGEPIAPRYKGGPTIHTVSECAVQQLIFWNDLRSNTWLRELCELRAEQLLDDGYYEVVDRPEGSRPDHG